jgi:hypothetical protein
LASDADGINSLEAETQGDAGAVSTGSITDTLFFPRLFFSRHTLLHVFLICPDFPKNSQGIG